MGASSTDHGRPGKVDLLDEINGALERMTSDGTLQRLYDEWFPGMRVPDSVLK
jgi:ABC-type amino acid transport substrate-binding protein